VKKILLLRKIGLNFDNVEFDNVKIDNMELYSGKIDSIGSTA
jgi:hypothetical protein